MLTLTLPGREEGSLRREVNLENVLNSKVLNNLKGLSIHHLDAI
jgi:hypothetical protein